MEKEPDIKTKIREKFTLKNLKKSAKQALALFLAIIIAFGLGFYIGTTKPWERYNPSPIQVVDPNPDIDYTLTISTIKEILEPASDLITSKYKYKDADTYKNFKTILDKKVPFTTDMTVFTYEGSVSLGIDLLDVEYEIDNNNKIINIQIPEMKILSNEIDDSSFEYPFIEDSVFNSTDMSDFTELIRKLKENKAKTVLNDKEFMNSAKKNTEVVLKGFLTSSDATTNFNVNFK